MEGGDTDLKASPPTAALPVALTGTPCGYIRENGLHHFKVAHMRPTFQLTFVQFSGVVLFCFVLFCFSEGDRRMDERAGEGRGRSKLDCQKEKEKVSKTR